MFFEVYYFSQSTFEKYRYVVSIFTVWKVNVIENILGPEVRYTELSLCTLRT